MKSVREWSFWEQGQWLAPADLLVIGSGIVGLNIARAVKLLHPHWRVLVADRSAIPLGASTRNAGFACFGSMTELMDDLEQMSEDQVFTLVERRWQGLLRLRSVLKDPNIGFEAYGSCELFAEEENLKWKACIELMPWFNEHLSRITGHKRVFRPADDEIVPSGFQKTSHMIRNTAEAQIDTGMMMKNLLRLVQEIGVEVLHAAKVQSWSPKSSAWEVNFEEAYSLITQRIAVATNGFAGDLLPELELFPARAQVLVTSPIENLKWKGCFHREAGYYYFRNVGPRVLYGGGRNLDFKTEETAEFGLTTMVQEKLERDLHEIILPGVDFSIEQRWSGIMGLPRRQPIIQSFKNGIYCAVRMGGMGVALGTLAGEELARIIHDEA